MVDVLVLGPIEARDADEPIVLNSRVQRALLAAFVHARGRVVPTEDLITLAWGDDPPASAQTTVKSHVSRLRRALREDVVASRPPGYALTLPLQQLDVHRFERGVHGAGSVADIEATLTLWRGRPYGELADHELLAGEVARLTELHAQARRHRAELLLAADRGEEAAAAYRQLTTEEPLREAAWTGLLRALHAVGRQADATTEARRYRELAADVGLEPSPRFLEAEHEVFTTPPPTVGRRHAGTRVPGRLSSIVGRRRELEQLDALVRRRRLVTLVGPGGVGKTTLAMQAARTIADDLDDGAWIVTLADIADGASVVPAISRAVEAPATEPLDTSLEQYLVGRRALLVVDNAEHVREAVRAVAVRLLAVADELRMLVTSRQPLDVSGEVVVPVEPLERDAAAELFRQRAADAGAPITLDQHDLAAEVCDRLDRLPLAIEMAAARLRGLGLVDLAARLDERLQLLQSGEPGRHETLAAVVAWSYDLLHTVQRSLVDQLSVFAGAFDLDAAEAVCEVTDVPGGVVDLVDRSLVHRAPDSGHARFQLLETVRAFAADRLADSDVHSGTVERFVRYHADLAERIDDGLRGPEEETWAELLDTQLPNLEAAHGHALKRGDVDAAVRIAVAPHVFVYHRLRADVGAWAEATLPVARRAQHPLTPAVAALVAVNRLHRGDLDGAEALLVDLPDDPVARHAHEVRGDLNLYRGELDAALGHFETAERLARHVDDRFTTLHSRMSQGMVLGYLGRTEDGLQLIDAVRREASETRLPMVAVWCDFTEGELLAESQPERALELVDRVVAEADRAGWRMGAGVGRLTASSLRARTADPADAVPGFERLIRHWDRVGDETHQWTTLRNLVELLTRLGAYAPAARLLGAVSTATRPTFGPEQRRLEAARQEMRAHLGDEVGCLIRVGREDDLAAAVELGLATLRQLEDVDQSRAGT
jgi:predicted ATPase/DNA-binding SARP family transcriptional activator